MSVTIYTGTCTMSVTDNTATITFVSDDTDGGFALLTTGARFECTVGSGSVDSNTGTVITISCWSGDSTTDTISWKGIPPLTNAASASAALEVLRGLNTLNTLPTGRVMTAAASTTLKRLDALAGGFRFISMALTAPPDSPAEGDCYLIASDASGAWADEDGNIARYLNSAWQIFAPVTGMLAYNAADGGYYYYDGSDWSCVLNLGGTLKTAGAATISGDYDLNVTIASDTDVTFPSSGVLASRSLKNTFTQLMTLDGTTNSLTTMLDVIGYTSGTVAIFESPGNAAIELVRTGDNGGTITISSSTGGDGGFSAPRHVILKSLDSEYECYFDSSGNLRRNTANAGAVGSEIYPWANGYFENGVTTTSDEQLKRKKALISASDDLLCVGWYMAQHLASYKMAAAVNQKGDDARTHFGLTAQDAMAAFTFAGLDWTDYGVVCSTVLTEDYLAPDGTTVLLASGSTTYYVRQAEADALISAARTARDLGTFPTSTYEAYETAAEDSSTSSASDTSSTSSTTSTTTTASSAMHKSGTPQIVGRDPTQAEMNALARKLSGQS